MKHQFYGLFAAMILYGCGPQEEQLPSLMTIFWWTFGALFSIAISASVIALICCVVMVIFVSLRGIVRMITEDV